MAWIGVDLDGTLAVHKVGQGVDEIGAPVPDMLNRVRRWLDDGIEVKILTARVCNAGPEGDKDYGDYVLRQTTMVQDWLADQGLPRLDVVAQKDQAMVELWDDLAVCVERNTGKQLSPSKYGG